MPASLYLLIFETVPYCKRVEGVYRRADAVASPGYKEWYKSEKKIKKVENFTMA